VTAEALLDEIPGLVSSDGKAAVRGGRGVRARLQAAAARRKRPAAAVRTGGSGSGSVARVEAPHPEVRIEVPEAAARARGPAVKDSTEHRQQTRRTGGTGAANGTVPGRKMGSKPAPDILSDQPKWVADLFEAHFRSSRTTELRHLPIGPGGKNRMKMSRADFAIGWLVMFESARRDVSNLRVRGSA